MASTRFKKILIFRFLTYFMVLLGLAILVLELGPLTIAEFNYRKDQVFGVKHTLPPQVITSQATESGTPISPSPDAQAEEGFENVSQTPDYVIKPVSTEYGIVIEKINANAKVIANVNPGIESEYVKALAEGVAEAAGSTKPGEAGNLFIFSHSTDAPWNIVRYNAIFFLLREMQIGDRISIFYNNRRYDYIVYDKTIAKADDISFLTNRYDKPVLTMQTCDPPGTTLNRLIVRAKLVGS